MKTKTKMKKTIEIPNPLFWIFSKHECQYANLISDIPMENNTNYLITQCKCGKVSVDRVHRESERYLNQNKDE